MRIIDLIFHISQGRIPLMDIASAMHARILPFRRTASLEQTRLVAPLRALLVMLARRAQWARCTYVQLVSIVTDVVGGYTQWVIIDVACSCAGTYSLAGSTTCSQCSATSYSIPGAYGCTNYNSPPGYPSPPRTIPPPGYGSSSPSPPSPPLPPFPPAPPGAPLPTSNTSPVAAVTNRTVGTIIVSIPQSTTLTLSAVACSSIYNFTAPFIYSFQATTKDAWNKANSGLQILQGDIAVSTSSVQAFCSSTASGRRHLSGVSTVIVSSSIQTPPGTSEDAANSGATAYNPNAQRAYASSQFSSDYQVSSVTTFTLPASSAIYSLPAPPPASPAGYSSSSSSTTTNNGLVIGLSVGLFIAGAMIAGVAVFFVVSRRDSQRIEPK